MNAGTRWNVALALVTLVLLAGCSQIETYLQERSVRNEFQQACPKPDWWDDVEPHVRIHTYDDLSSYWRRDDRTPSQFFKAAYQAILDHPLNQDLVVNAISLMGSAVRDYPHRQALLEFALDRHFDYDRPTEHYLGKSGDTVAGIARKLAQLYNANHEYEKTLALVDRLLAEREAEINDQLLELLHLPYARALHEQGRTDEALAALDRAIEQYDGDWEERLRERRQEYAALR